MTHDDNIERVLERWFAEGPRHMSDRLFDGTLERIERLPKRRLAGVGLRLPDMYLNVRLVAAAMVLVALAGAGLVVINGMPGVGSQPSPTPSAGNGFPSASDLRGHWIATSPRPINNGSDTAIWEMAIDPETFEVGRTGHTVAGPWSISEAGTLSFGLWSQPANWSCGLGNTGAYDVRLSNDVLTIRLRNDQCGVRPGMLVGDWVRTATPSLTTAPGSAHRYVAPGFRPFGLGTTGTLSATVPLSGSELEQTTELNLVNPFGPPGSSFIYIVSGIRPGTEPASASCAAPFSAPQRTPAALATWIGTFASLDVSAPQPVNIGGLPGLLVDITERPDASRTCGVPRTDGQRIEVLGGGSWIYPGLKLRLILLDRGDGESILIDIGTSIETSGETTWDSVNAAMSIVSDFEFTR